MARSGSPLSRAELAIAVATRRLIHRVHTESGLAYADEVCGPISPMSVQIIARQLGADIIYDDLGEHAQEIGIPGYLGPPVIVVNRYAESTMRDLACRHGLAHLLAGDLDVGEGNDIRFMSSIFAYMSQEERTADCFALADLVPNYAIEAFLAAEVPTARVERELRRHVQALAPRWPAVRVRDRTRLRLALFWE